MPDDILNVRNNNLDFTFQNASFSIIHAHIYLYKSDINKERLNKR